MADLYQGRALLDTITKSVDTGRSHGSPRRRRRNVSGTPVATGRAPQPILIDVRHLLWQLDAACRDVDPEIFFDEEQDLAVLRRLCAGCPVIAECRAYADEHRLTGFWANSTAAERARARARARKQARELGEAQ